MTKISEEFEFCPKCKGVKNRDALCPFCSTATGQSTVQNIGSLPIPSGERGAGPVPPTWHDGPECPECHGVGQYDSGDPMAKLRGDYTCETCQGTGTVALAQIEETAYTPAEANILHIAQLIGGAKRDILTIAQLLCVNQDNAYWSITEKWDTFQDYIQSLGIGSYSWITRLMGVVRLLASKQLTAPDVDEMGLANAGVLVAVAHKRALTDMDIAAAKGPPNDFKRYLGYKITELDHESSVLCPRCGFEIEGAKWVRVAPTQRKEG